MHNTHRLAAVLCLLVWMSPLMAEPTIKIEPYTQDEFPSWAQDLRRTEIITLGSLPFTTFAAKLGYTIWRYVDQGFDSAYVPNPLSKTSEGSRLDTDEQKTVLKIAFTSSVIFGLTDLTIRLLDRWNATKENQQVQAELEESVIITPLEDDSAVEVGE